jgi:hypothetical protein
VVLGQLKQGAVALARDDRKEPADLVLREEVISVGSVASWDGLMNPTV